MAYGNNFSITQKSQLFICYFSHYFNILCHQVPAEDLKVKNTAKHYNPQEAQADVTFSEKVCRKQSSFMSEEAFSCPHSLSGSRILGYKPCFISFWFSGLLLRNVCYSHSCSFVVELSFFILGLLGSSHFLVLRIHSYYV